MLRVRIPKEPTWLVWDGEDFPYKSESSSVVFYLSEKIYFDSDDSYRQSLAKAIQQEGISETFGEANKLIQNSWVTHAAYYYPEGDRFPVYAEDDDRNGEWDATYVEVENVY